MFCSDAAIPLNTRQFSAMGDNKVTLTNETWFSVSDWSLYDGADVTTIVMVEKVNYNVTTCLLAGYGIKTSIEMMKRNCLNSTHI